MRTTAAAQSCDVTVGPGDDLQTAIDSASQGSTVYVAPGTYDGTVTVGVEDLTLRWTELRGATVADGDSTTGAALSVAADGVTVEGFEVTFPDGLLGIAVQPGYDGVTVRNNHVDGVGPVGGLGATGIIGGGAHDDLTVRSNVVTDIRNEIRGSSISPTVNGIFVDDQDSGSLTDNTIASNVVRNLASDVASIGIILGIDASGVEVRDNEVSGLVADPAVDSDDTDDAYDYNHRPSPRGSTSAAGRRTSGSRETSSGTCAQPTSLARG